MDKNTILSQLLLLSKRHLELALEEKWDEWEAVAGEKKRLYEQITAAKSWPLDKGDEHDVAEIRRIEKETNEVLENKKRETKRELAKIIRLKCAFKGYRRTNRRTGRRHFDLQC